MAWKIIFNFLERIICASSRFSMLGPWFFLLGLTWGHSSVWSDSLSSVPLALHSVRELIEETGEEDICLEFRSGLTASPFKERPSLEWSVQIFSSDLNMVKISTIHFWHPVSSFSP